MDFLKRAGTAVSSAASAAAASAKKTYEDLKAPPTSVRCTACPTEIQVPPTVFDWVCAGGHVSKRADNQCGECHAQQPANLPAPTVTCPQCQSVTVVPSTNAAKHAREAAVKTKEFAVATAVSAKQGVAHLRADPDTFHCQHCDALLGVPTGPWACQTCTSENEEGAKTCKQCGQKKSDQKAICGVCRQSTSIPTSNFEDGLKHTFKDLHQSSKKVYFDLAGKPYITCNKCGAHVNVDKDKVSKVRGGGNSPQAVQAEQKQEAGEEKEGQSSPAPGGAAPSPSSGSVYNGETVTCTNCKNPIDSPVAQ